MAGTLAERLEALVSEQLTHLERISGAGRLEDEDLKALDSLARLVRTLAVHSSAISGDDDMILPANVTPESVAAAILKLKPGG